jgi:D-alanyl-D-alanine carboxypeptidase
MGNMKKSFTIIIIAALVAVGAWFFAQRSDGAKTGGTSKDGSATAFNKERFSLTNPTSIWVITDKHRPLDPKTYAPDDLVAPAIPLRLTAKDDEMKLRREAANALKELHDGAARQSLQLMVSSAYRSYNFQSGLYNRYVQQQGRAAADTQSARPGFSEHQTGLAVDVEPASRKCEVEACFSQTPEGQWVAANAYTYGFIVRYPEGKQQVTGYIYEPWHLRYVGKTLAAEVHKQGNPTLEEFFGLEEAPDYL